MVEGQIVENIYGCNLSSSWVNFQGCILNGIGLWYSKMKGALSDVKCLSEIVYGNVVNNLSQVIYESK